MTGLVEAQMNVFTDTLYVVVEFATVGQTKEGTIYHHLWDADAINALLKENDLGKKAGEGEEETTT